MCGAIARECFQKQVHTMHANLVIPSQRAHKQVQAEILQYIALNALSRQAQAKPHTLRVRLPGMFLSKTLRHVHTRLVVLKFANLSTIVVGARLDVPKVNFMRATCSFQVTEHVKENMHVPGTIRASTDPWWHDHDKVG